MHIATAAPMHVSAAMIFNTMKTTFVLDVSENFNGTAHLYRCEPPVRYFDNDDKLRESKYVVVSAVEKPLDTSRPETLIFPSFGNGQVENWKALPGSITGSLNIEEAIAGLEDEPVPEWLDEGDEAWSWVDEEELNSPE